MAETRIESAGWKAIVVGLPSLGVFGFRIYLHFPTASDDGREALRSWLVKDFTGRGPKALAQRFADSQEGVPETLDLPTVSEPHIEFVSVSAHGWRDAMVVRTEITVDGGPPPVG